LGIGLKKVNPTSDCNAVLAAYWENEDGRGSIEKSDPLSKVHV
jgi:hypothetical protein